MYRPEYLLPFFVFTPLWKEKMVVEVNTAQTGRTAGSVQVEGMDLAGTQQTALNTWELSVASIKWIDSL